MNREDIIRMAREAGLLVIGTAEGSEAVYTWPQGITDELQRFADLVAAAEREACARVCDETLAQHYMKQTIPARDESLLLAACADCAAAIRARGETK